MSFGGRISLSLVKECTANMWEVRKLHDNESCPNQLQSQSEAGDLGDITEIVGQRKGIGWITKVTSMVI